MSREEKIEAMARAWCTYNGWIPDHCPQELDWVTEPGNPPKIVKIEPKDGQPIWKSHRAGMDAILKAIGQ